MSSTKRAVDSGADGDPCQHAQAQLYDGMSPDAVEGIRM
jgi:hypothetical protein